MNSPDNRMTIVDLRIPFFRLVFFFVKSALAATLAAIILALIFSLLGLATSATFYGVLPDLQKYIDMMMRRLTI
jgi:hypothetical protein